MSDEADYLPHYVSDEHVYQSGLVLGLLMKVGLQLDFDEWRSPKLYLVIERSAIGLTPLRIPLAVLPPEP